MPKGFRKSNNAAPSGATRFYIGEANGVNFWTNIAFDHENGKLTNEQLMSMADARNYFQLELLAYGDPKLREPVKTELYRRGPDQDGPVGELYAATHRAVAILAYLREKTAVENRTKAAEQEQMALSAQR